MSVSQAPSGIQHRYGKARFTAMSIGFYRGPKVGASLKEREVQNPPSDPAVTERLA